MVLLIAALHAVPLLLVPVFSSKITTLNTATVIMCVIAVASGSAQYIVADLIAVAIGYAVAKSSLAN